MFHLYDIKLFRPDNVFKLILKPKKPHIFNPLWIVISIIYQKKTVVYRFKVFGEHTFPKFTFEDIKNDKCLMYDINPVDLMKIAIDDYVDIQQKSMLRVSEILRDNKYKLSDNNNEAILSGDEICDNVLLIEKIKNLDLYKIVYNTAFNHGRQFSQEINRQSSSNDYPKNVFPLKNIENDNG